MAINKNILVKVMEKTENNDNMRNFIVNILQEESKGIGWYSKLYKTEIDKATKGGHSDED